MNIKQRHSNKRLFQIQHLISSSEHFGERGQLMLITVLILGGAMIGASLIAGFLITRNVRQSTLATDSAKAIFAADAGVDYMTYHCFSEVNQITGIVDGCSDADTGEINTCDGATRAPFSNGSCYIVTYSKDATTGLFTQMESTGYSNYLTKLVVRKLVVTFQ